MEEKYYKVTLVYTQRVYLPAPTEQHAKEDALYKVTPPSFPEVRVEEAVICRECWEFLDERHPTSCPLNSKHNRS